MATSSRSTEEGGRIATRFRYRTPRNGEGPFGVAIRNPKEENRTPGLTPANSEGGVGVSHQKSLAAIFRRDALPRGRVYVLLVTAQPEEVLRAGSGETVAL